MCIRDSPKIAVKSISSPLYYLDDLDTPLASSSASVTGTSVEGAFEEVGDTITIVTDPLKYNSTYEASTDNTKTFWGKDFLTVRIDDEGGDKAFTSVDVRPGTYTAETLASEVERAINNALSDDKKISLDPVKDGSFSIKFNQINADDEVVALNAISVNLLREEISSILSADTKCQEVVLNLESGGGTVIGYGLAAAQLSRLKDSKIKLTVCIDKVAASGGYMMACIADKIIASPFALIGSIGVIGAVPNFNKLLKKNNIEYEMHTAGEYKRTITMFGENTDEGREKFKDDLANIHELFKKHVAKYRPSLDVIKVATGEVWQGIEAVSYTHLTLPTKRIV